MKLYLAGPMRGYDRQNFPAFWRAEKALTDNGYDIESPAFPEDLNRLGDPNYPLEYYLRRDIMTITRCEGVVLLPHWEGSMGVAFELQVAQGLGLKIFEIRWTGPETDDVDLKEVTDDLGDRPWEDERVRLVSQFGREA